MSSRCDSLAAELERGGHFAEYFDWCALERPSPRARLRKLKGWGIETSFSSLRRLHRSPEAFRWRHQEGLKARANRDEVTPAEIKGAMREAILDQAYDEVVGDLTHKEKMDFLILFHEEEKLDWQKGKFAKQVEIKREDQRIAMQRLVSKIQAGLDALGEEIKGNPRAQEHFDAMQAALKEARA